MKDLKNKVLNIVNENARWSNKQIANVLGVAERQVDEIIENLEKEGVIVKYSAIINTEAIESKLVEALVEVKVVPQKLKGFDSYAEEIYNFPEVKSLYLMSGGFDLAIFVCGKDIADIATFISEKLSVIDGISSVQTHFILKKYKIEGHITKPSEEGKRQLFQA